MLSLIKNLLASPEMEAQVAKTMCAERFSKPGSEEYYSDPVDYEDALGDLLSDLMHLSDREPFDFEAALAHAHGHYAAETGAAPY